MAPYASVVPSYAPATSLTPIPGVPFASAASAASGKVDGNEAKADVKKATVVVSLPADAKLFFDGKQTKTTSDRREFVSPELEPGLDYHYTIKAEIVRAGKTDTKTETVTVRAGKVSRISFEFPTAVAAK